jgi:hypothetical protein
MRSNGERAAYAAKDVVAREKHWRDLIAELRKANPAQGIAYRNSDKTLRYVVIDGTAVAIRLDKQRPTYGGWTARPNGVYYFTIFGGARPRAVQGKRGFNWPRIAQLVERARVELMATAKNDASAKATLAKATKELDALFRRRPDLEDERSLIDVSSRDGSFQYTVRSMDVATLEGVLVLAKKLGTR